MQTTTHSYDVQSLPSETTKSAVQRDYPYGCTNGSGETVSQMLGGVAKDDGSGVSEVVLGATFKVTGTEKLCLILYLRLNLYILIY